MTGFVPLVLSGESADPEASVAADGWFPAIDPAAIRSAQRIASDVVPERLREAILAAMIERMNDLAAWTAARRAAGAASLADVVDVPNPKLGGEPRLVILWRRAIGATVKADLIERTRDNAVPSGQRRADELEPGVGELRRDALYAVRDMLGRTRTFVELI